MDPEEAEPLFEERFGIPTRTDLDGRLIAGAGLFGVGWAIGGYCPGPGLVSAASGSGSALIFVAAMTGGMLAFHVAEEAWKGRQAHKAGFNGTTDGGTKIDPDTVLKLRS